MRNVGELELHARRAAFDDAVAIREAGQGRSIRSHDDVEAVRIIRDAMERAADAEADSIALLDAKAELSQGNVEAARTHAEAAVALDGDRADNLVALVETHFRKLQPIRTPPVQAGPPLFALPGCASGPPAGNRKAPCSRCRGPRCLIEVVG